METESFDRATHKEKITLMCACAFVCVCRNVIVQLFPGNNQDPSFVSPFSASMIIIPISDTECFCVAAILAQQTNPNTQSGHRYINTLRINVGFFRFVYSLMDMRVVFVCGWINEYVTTTKLNIDATALIIRLAIQIRVLYMHVHVSAFIVHVRMCTNWGRMN